MHLRVGNRQGDLGFFPVLDCVLYLASDIFRAGIGNQNCFPDPEQSVIVSVLQRFSKHTRGNYSVCETLSDVQFLETDEHGTFFVKASAVPFSNHVAWSHLVPSFGSE